MREAFDRTFAHAPRPPQQAQNAMLALRVAGSPFAVQLAEVAELRADCPVVSFPTPVPGLLGIASLRGHLAPVFDLAAVLGMGADEAPRWVILARGPTPVAFAFEHFEGHFTAAALRDAVEGLGAVRPVIQLNAALEEIRRRVQPEQRS